MDVDQQSFTKEVLESDRLVLVDFWAPWCGPCQMMGPILDNLEQDLVGKIKIVKVNIDQNQDLASQYNIMSIPALFLFQNGQIVKQWLGLQSIEALKEEISAILS
ncbi:MAG: thioredoxin [Candidatus Shapirobacteria bacterium]|nr:thioredoxin [Candidatus Shapirobacteria bacterium]